MITTITYFYIKSVRMLYAVKNRLWPTFKTLTFRWLLFQFLNIRIFLIHRVRFHYGHPDIFDRLFHITRGGVSKASKTINLSEDIFSGKFSLYHAPKKDFLLQY